MGIGTPAYTHASANTETRGEKVQEVSKRKTYVLQHPCRSTSFNSSCSPRRGRTRKEHGEFTEKEKGRGVAKHSERSDEARSGRGWPLKDLVNKKAVAAAWVVQSSGIDEETRRKGARCKSGGRRGKTERFIESTTRTAWKQWVLGRESRWEHKFPAFCVKACRDSVKRTQGWGLGCDRRGRRKKVEEEWNG